MDFEINLTKIVERLKKLGIDGCTLGCSPKWVRLLTPLLKFPFFNEPCRNGK